MKPLVYKKAKRKRQKTRRARKLHVTKGDTVRVMRGDDRGTEGSVLQVNPKTGRVVIEGVNLVKRHRAATATDEGGIIEFPAPIDASNVMLLDPSSGDPTRVKRRVDKDGTVERIAAKSDQPIPRVR